MFYRLKDKQRDLEKSLDSYVETHVDQTWNSLLEGLERIDAAMEDYISNGNGGDHGALF